MTEIDLGVEAGEWAELGDGEGLCRRAVACALEAAGADTGEGVCVSLLLTDDAAMRELNRAWRGKDAPTNVLSFPAPAQPSGAGPRHLGDIVLAYGTLAREAREEAKSLADHASHLIVHGVLHCLGYDHQTDEEAEEMEALERAALARIGVADPYGEAAVSGSGSTAALGREQ